MIVAVHSKNATVFDSKKAAIAYFTEKAAGTGKANLISRYQAAVDSLAALKIRKGENVIIEY